MTTNEFNKWKDKALNNGELITSISGSLFNHADLEKAWNARGNADVKKLEKYFNSHIKLHGGDKRNCSLTMGMELAICILKEVL